MITQRSTSRAGVSRSSKPFRCLAFPSLGSLLGRGRCCRVGRPWRSEGCSRRVWSLLRRAAAMGCLAGPLASDPLLYRAGSSQVRGGRLLFRSQLEVYTPPRLPGYYPVRLGRHFRNPDSGIIIASCWDGGAAGQVLRMKVLLGIESVSTTAAFLGVVFL